MTLSTLHLEKMISDIDELVSVLDLEMDYGFTSKGDERIWNERFGKLVKIRKLVVSALDLVEEFNSIGG